MNDLVWMAAAAAAGAGLGFFFFTGLYLTVRRLPGAKNPGLLTFTSFMARMGAIVFVLYLLARSGEWTRVIACLAGFLIVRMILMRKFKTSGLQEDAREYNA
jgi:F1F0 ATPase subunit 2